MSISAYKFELSAYNAVLDYFSLREEDTTWIIPVLVRVSNDLRIIAERVSVNILTLYCGMTSCVFDLRLNSSIN